MNSRQITLSYFIVILLLNFLNCAPFHKTSAEQGELIVYLQTVGHPVDLNFVLEEVKIEDRTGTRFTLIPRTPKIEAISLVNKQILFLKEKLSPNNYQKLYFKVKQASSKSQPLLLASKGLFEVPIFVRIRPKRTSTLFLTWYPSESVKNGVFNLTLEIGRGRTGLKQLLLYVSNSGDNYISVIDRGTHQVIETITVGKAPKGMILSSDRTRLYVVNSISQNISVIEVMSNRVIDTISCPMGVGLAELALVTTGGREYLYITATDSNAVLVIDAESKHFIKKIDVGQRPIGIASDPQGRYVYVANSYSNNISVIDTLDNVIVYTIGVEGEPKFVAVTNTYLIVSNRQTNTVTVLRRPFGEEVLTIFVPSAPGRIIQGIQGWFYVAGEKGNDISYINPVSSVVFKKIPVGQFPCGLAIDTDRKLLYVTNLKENTVSVIDLIKEREKDRISVGEAPYALVLTGE